MEQSRISEPTYSLCRNGLKDRVAVIASHRSGKCVPSELAQILTWEGAIVYTADTNPKIARIVSEETRNATGKNVDTRALDFFAPGAVERFVGEIYHKEGRIDILATDFGLLDFLHHLQAFHRQTKEEWKNQFRDIFETTLLWSQAVLPYMMENKFGRIVHVVSDAGRVGVPKMSVYGAFKAAVSAFSRSLAQEAARYRITVNCVSIGIQEIDEIKDPSEEAVVKLDRTLKLVPLRRYSEPEEIAAMIAYLASDLGAYITGQTFSVSGGLVMP